MIKNFVLKKGDQLAFSITFTSPTPATAMEFGVKEKYSDDYYTIIKTMEKKQRKVIFIGDSYAEGYTPDGRVIGWPEVVKNILDLQNPIISYRGGTGFISGLENGSFTDLLSAIPSDTSVTDVVVAGGYNDRYGNKTKVVEGITRFCNVSRNKFPNAKISIGMIGWSTIERQQESLRVAIEGYKEGCAVNDVTYMTDAETSLRSSSLFSSDQIHPNQSGENVIAMNIAKYLPDTYTGGISKVSDTKYQIIIPSEDTAKLDIRNYVYDLRLKVNNVVKTPLSGKLMIKDSVFED